MNPTLETSQTFSTIREQSEQFIFVSKAWEVSLRRPIVLSPPPKAQRMTKLVVPLGANSTFKQSFHSYGALLLGATKVSSIPKCALLNTQTNIDEMSTHFL